MHRRTVIWTGGLALILASRVCAWLFAFRAPPLVAALRALPEVASVQYTWPREPRLVVVQIRDWHFVGREGCELEGLDYAEHLSDVERVQADQLAIARFLLKEHSVRRVFAERLTERSLPDFRLRLDLLKTLAEAEKTGLLKDDERMLQREYTLEVGVGGRLLLSGEIDEVVPLDDAKALDASAPIVVGPGKVRFDAEKVAERRRAMVARLPKEGIALSRAWRFARSWAILARNRLRARDGASVSR